MKTEIHLLITFKSNLPSSSWVQSLNDCRHVAEDARVHQSWKEKDFIIETEWNLKKETEEIVRAFSSCCLCCIWWFQKRYWYKLRCNNKININDERSDSVVTKKQMHLGNLTWEYLQTIETTKTIKWDRKYKYYLIYFKSLSVLSCDAIISVEALFEQFMLKPPWRQDTSGNSYFGTILHFI